MTGKSTFLDGLRVHVGAPLPNDKSIRDQVEIRGRDIFGAGSPVVELDCPGSDPTAPPHERWPAQFFAQNELQRLSIEASAVEDILARLVPSEARGIDERDKELRELDRQLHDMTKRLAALDDSLAEAEQAYARAGNAKDALAAFSEAGVEGLHQASRDLQRWAEVRQGAETIRNDVHAVALAVRSLDVPGPEHETAGAPVPESTAPEEANLERRWSRIDEQVRRIEQELDGWLDEAARVVDALEKNQDGLRVAVERALPSVVLMRESSGKFRSSIVRRPFFQAMKRIWTRRDGASTMRRRSSPVRAKSAEPSSASSERHSIAWWPTSNAGSEGAFARAAPTTATSGPSTGFCAISGRRGSHVGGTT